MAAAVHATGDDTGSWDWDSLMSEVIDQKLCEELLQNDFVVREAVFMTAACRFRDEARQLYEDGGMKEHTFRFGGSRSQADGRPVIFRKPHIYEADMHDPSLAGAPIGAFRGFFNSGALPRALSAHLPQLGLVCDSQGVTLKLQKNNGKGGAFAHHYDNPGPPNKRALTCLLYLNDGWEEGDGGELELQPLFKPPIVLSPTLGKFVVFRSDRVLHRVKPARAPRLCFTVWVDGTTVNEPDEVHLKAKHIDTTGGTAGGTTGGTTIVRERAEFLARSPLQRVLSRAIYASEYEASLRECMLEPQGVEHSGLQAANAMLAEHSAHVKALRTNPALASFIRTMETHKATEAGN